MYMSVWLDTHELTRKSISSNELANRDMLDEFIIRELKHLAMVLLKHRKAAKAWSLRFDLLCKLKAFKKF